MAGNAKIDLGTIGVIGLGNMGLALAQRVATQFPVIGSDLSPERQSMAREADIEVGELTDITRRCNIVLLSLPHPKVSLSIAKAIGSSQGVVDTILETSTVTPSDVIALQHVLTGTGIEVLDMAILSGVKPMQSGTAGLLVAGASPTIDRIEPLLETITSNRHVLGALGTGMAAKVINNAVAHAVMVLLGEAMAMAKTAGVDLNEMVTILAEDKGGLMRPLTHRIAERAFSGHYEGGMPLEAARKDSILAQTMAQDAGVPIFTISAAHTVYDIAMSNGWARDDYASLVKLWEQWCGVSFVQAPGSVAP